MTISTADIQSITHDSGNADIIDKLTVGADLFTLGGGGLDILTTASFADGYNQTGGALTVGAISITGNVSLSGGASEGATSFSVTGTTTLSNYTLGGASLLTVKTVADQTGQITLGDSTGVGAAIDTASGGVYDIAGDFGIGGGASSATFTDAGTLEKGAGSGVSTIGVSVASTGTLSAASGELQLDGPTNTIGGTLSGAGEIAFGAGVTTLSATSATVGSLGLYGSATLNLKTNIDYEGVFYDQSNGNSTFNLGAQGFALYGASATFQGNFGAADVTGSGTLTNKSVMSLSAVDFGGTLKVDNDKTIDQTGTVTFGDGSGATPTITNLSGGVYDFTDSATLGENDATVTFTNAGVLEETGGAGQTSLISMAVTNSGTISAQGGALNFDGAVVNTGQISGSGLVEVTGGGSLTLDAGSAMTVANFGLNNTADLTLGVSLTYAGVFSDVSNGPNELNLGANTFTLTGDSNVFQGNYGVADIAGTGILANKGEFSISNALVDGTAEIDNTGWINQAGGVQIGGGGGGVASIVNATGARYNVTGAFNITNGAATASNFANSGTVVVSAGTGTATFATTFDNLSGGTLKIATGALDTTGILVNAATISGTQLILGGGQTTFAAGSVLSVSQIDLDNAASLTLGASFTYAGDFVDASNGNNEINLGATTLTLSGQSEFDSAFGNDVVTGTGALDLTHASLLEGSPLLIGGTATLNVESTLTVTGGLQVGDSSANAAAATITAKGVYDLTADAGVARGSSAASTLTNDGLFEKTAGTGTSVVSVDFVNDGTITVTSGTLEFLKGTLTNKGTINGTVSFDTNGDELITAKTPAVKQAKASEAAVAAATTKAASPAAASLPSAVSLLAQAAAGFGVDQGMVAPPADRVSAWQAASLVLLGARHLV